LRKIFGNNPHVTNYLPKTREKQAKNY